MRRDVEQWLKDGEMHDHPHSRTGATALHVAAAKGLLFVSLQENQNKNRI